ncbi:hypothetical protein [Natrarchaeobius chitinivorans]|uniref:Uncharacterized protein n=1 Tax=Natrarchaeobius chitinivorans TaxID=1679083 RepID=A0A3N6M1Y8_NATCH|nr:hypothetical protein [Natrarchaeobius chitinivorans]RQG97343.1 hypothetical protein EA473_04355 [Natrarchaeobius chitinivorans]
MVPPVFSRESILSDELNPLTEAYRDAVVYDGANADDSLYEGPIIVHANGWIELEGNRLLSPAAIHHIDVYDDDLERRGTRGGTDSRSGDDGTGGRRTNRFSPR